MFACVAVILMSCATNRKVTLTDDSAVETGILQKKWQQGTGFYAIGTEPFWNLEVRPEKEIVFATSDGKTFIFPVENVQFTSVSPFSFTARNANESMECTTSQGPCLDGMSDSEFGFLVEIAIRDASQNIENFKGCGNTVPDFSLDGEWKLIELNSIRVIESDFYGNNPVFSFAMEERQFGGSSGCNRTTCKVEAIEGKITFGSMMSTKMACPEGKEDALFQAFEQCKAYKFENNLLVLMDKNQLVLLRFEKL